MCGTARYVDGTPSMRNGAAFGRGLATGACTPTAPGVDHELELTRYAGHLKRADIMTF